MKKYFIHNGEEQEGPFNLDDLKSKNLSRSSKIWYEGLSEWTAADKIEDLKILFATIPPPLVEKEIRETKPVSKKSNTRKKVLLLVGIMVIALIGYFAFILIQEQNQKNDKSFYRNNISNYITAERSDYTYYEIGGIKDLSITVTNNTKYLIDKVVVKVSYIKTSGGIWKDELLNFNYISAYGTKSLKAPNSERGTKVSYQIISIQSMELGLY